MTDRKTKTAPADEQGARRRITQSQIIEQLLARGGSEHSSVTLSRNAKGETQIEVVVRTNEHGDIQTIEQAEQHARDIYDRLRTRYPMQSGFVGATPPAPAS